VADDDAGRPRVRVDRRGPVTTLTLDSPHNRNALSSGLLRELRDALHGAQADPDVRVVVLTGEGTAFCSGVDLHERLHPPDRGPEVDGSMVDGPAGKADRAAGDGEADGPASLPDVLSCLVGLPQPVIARVNGHVRGGGVGLVAACDLAVAAPSATFAFSEVRVGVAPAVIAVPGLRVMDRRAFARYALTGEPFGAADAASAGLLTTVTDDVDGWVAGVVASVLRSSPAAVAATKELTGWPAVGAPGTGAAGAWDDAIAAAEALSDELFASADGIEGMAAFVEKRPARWVVE
jgi:enoyl-CoA hydratase/carnithine racemase